MKEILELVIKSLVHDPDKVSVKKISDAKSLKYEVRVSEDDMGRVIGKQGKIAKSIRTVMKAIALKDKKRIIIDFVE